MICNFSSSISTDALYRENASPSVWIRKASLPQPIPEGLRMIVISFARMFPKNALGNSHTALQRRHMVRYHDIDAAIRHGRLQGKSKTAAFIWKIHKSHKKSFSNICFSRQAALPSTLSAGLFQTVKGNYCVTVYPALFYSSRFFHCDAHFMTDSCVEPHP